MKPRPTMKTSVLVAIVPLALCMTSMVLSAQWTKVPAAAIPRTADGKPDLSAPTPRLSDGTPDLAGIWEPIDNRYVGNIAAGMDPDAVPFNLGQGCLRIEKGWSQARDDPPASCLPQGVPRIGAAPAPWKIVQTPGFVVIVYEAFICGGRSLWMDASCYQIPTRRGWAIPPASGGRYVGRRYERLQWQRLVGSVGSPHDRRAACDRAIYKKRLRTHADPGNHRRSQGVTSPGRLPKQYVFSQTLSSEFICNEKQPGFGAPPHEIRTLAVTSQNLTYVSAAAA